MGDGLPGSRFGGWGGGISGRWFLLESMTNSWRAAELEHAAFNSACPAQMIETGGGWFGQFQRLLAFGPGDQYIRAAAIGLGAEQVGLDGVLIRFDGAKRLGIRQQATGCSERQIARARGQVRAQDTELGLAFDVMRAA